MLKKRIKMNDFSKILEISKQFENQYKEAQEKIKKIEIEGVSGADSVKVILDGEGNIKKLELSSELLKEEKQIIEDLIVAAFAQAKSKLKSKTTEEINKAAGGFGIPGFKFPL